VAPAFWHESGESANTNAKSRVCLRSKASEKARSLAKSDGARFMQATPYFQGGQAAQNKGSPHLPHSPRRRSGTLGQPLAAKPHQGRHPSKAPRTRSTGSHRCGRKQKCSTHLVMSFGRGADVLGITAEVLSKHHTRCSSVRLLSGRWRGVD